MKIIGHRGAAGAALENTVESIKKAVLLGADAIEFDVRMTKDGHFVLSHDPTLRRVSSSRQRIADTTLDVLSRTMLHNGEQPATLQEALTAARNTTVVIEAKAGGWARALAQELRNVPTDKAIIIARDHHELYAFHHLAPAFKTYLVQRFNPIELLQAIQDARRIGCTGVDLNFWLLNPLTYWAARRAKLDIIVYTVNSVMIGRFLARLFPDISITTNHPDKLAVLRIAGKTDASHT